MITLKIKAVQKESIAKPVTMWVHSNIMRAFMTTKKSPSVNIVTGKVNKTITGFTNTLSRPNTIATIIEVVKFSTWTPVMRCEITITKMAVTIILSKIFMVKYD